MSGTPIQMDHSHLGQCNIATGNGNTINAGENAGQTVYHLAVAGNRKNQVAVDGSNNNNEKKIKGNNNEKKGESEPT
ncbi:hypothetical protein LOK49_LG04G00643 [Camellia lanceoleosa]|uniref:Uncharacterized protein n=1 Tax=Camellia lanceoleosa TaxID=1840588 RepID=A0ACC0I0A7_9ERIC|nr:hypothetical protein LOK49_LG04G00643 [Camellia lanceoleosa]